MSKLPTYSSRLQPPSAIKRPPSDNGMDEGAVSPEKKSRTAGGRATQISKPAAGRGGLKRSFSVANVSAVGAQKDHSKNTLASSKFRSSTLNLTGRPSSVSSSVLANRVPTGPNGRRPGANITNHMSTRPPVSSKVSSTNKSLGSEGKSKRPGWDLKGRLQDMEALLKSREVEQKEWMKKFEEYDTRIETLETEKTHLSHDLVQTTTSYEANQEEIENLRRNLRKEQDQRCSEKNNYENTIQSLTFSKSNLERQVNSLDAEIAARQEEVAGLKFTVSELSSTQAGMEARLKSTESLLVERNQQITEMMAQIEEQKRKIEELNEKLQQGEMVRRKLHNTVLELKGNIRVFCRVRPLLNEEIQNNANSDVIHHINFIDEHTLEVGKGDVNTSSMSGLKSRGNNFTEFAYDRVFQPTATQAEVFEEISQLAQSALDGYNVCIFAYGQTGSGKTFTMEGVPNDEELEGMIPRTVKHIFKNMEELESKGWTYKVEASFLEIYNETIRDLLASPKEAKNLTYEIKFQDNKKNEIYVTNLKRIPVENEGKVHTLLNMAQQQRAVAATNMNEQSSRSHSVFQLRLSGENSKTGDSCEGMLNLVDLAGSERLKESKSEGARLVETQNINRSLANLGNVIMAIGQKQSHIPYRNSKLTHLLQNSLGGNSKALMFVNISPVEACLNETQNSLRFATRVNQCHIGVASKQIKK
ncbi:kinesin-like protein KIFC1 isoform X2 [Macrobrachium rosenbergii]|uniref:kinesin-like protein KIFC1 isoform X2 n=1 Tax=Macrobrachium rosenbergii TaxID=79674 RepID=UPI0034D41536